jgi:hypothetical protein
LTVIHEFVNFGEGGLASNIEARNFHIGLRFRCSRDRGVPV